MHCLASVMNSLLLPLRIDYVIFPAQRPILPVLCSLLELAYFAQISAGRLGACLACMQHKGYVEVAVNCSGKVHFPYMIIVAISTLSKTCPQ